MNIAYRAAILHFVDNPLSVSGPAYRYFEDGLLLVGNGRVTACADFEVLHAQLPPDCTLVDYRPFLIMPGFIDAHAHYAQTDIIASHGEQLLDWLQSYTYPQEERFSSMDVASDAAVFYVRELLRNGTTTAMVFATTSVPSVDAIFTAAGDENLRLIAGKVLMDRHAPEALCDSAQSGYDDSVMLIEKWHKRERLLYAVTPRFAPTSSEQQLAAAQQLLNEYPDVYLQSHVAENRSEVDWVAELFPWSRSYLDVYDHFGLLGDRSLYAHCIHLDDSDRRTLAQSGAAMAFCPSSNLFLGSGLLDMQAVTDLDQRLGLGTDIGAGSSFNLLKTMHDAYKVGQLSGFNPSPLYFFYLATLGAARALYLDPWLGNFEVGREADFVVLDCGATALMRRRSELAESLEELLFALMILGDDRSVVATHILGECRYRRDGGNPAS